MTEWAEIVVRDDELVAIDLALALAADVLDATTPATTEDCELLSREIVKARGLIYERLYPEAVI